MKKILLLFVLVIVLSASGCGPDSESQSGLTPQTHTVEPAPTPTPTPEPTPKYYFKDNVLVTEDVKIEIIGQEIIQVGEPGNEYGESPVIAFTFDTTNLTGNEAVNPISAWIAFFTAIQDNDPNYVNVLDVGLSPYDEYLDTQSVAIKKGGTVRNAIAYELDDLTTPVALIAQRIMDEEPLGTQIFDIT